MKGDYVRQLDEQVSLKDNACEKVNKAQIYWFPRQKVAYLLPLRSLSCKGRRRVSFVDPYRIVRCVVAGRSCGRVVQSIDMEQQH